MRQPRPEPDGRELALGHPERVAMAGELERDRDVLQRGHGRDEVEGLEDDADPRAPESREPVLVEAIEALPIDRDRARIRPLEPGDGHQQCRLARPRGADEPDGLAPPDVEGNPL